MSTHRPFFAIVAIAIATLLLQSCGQLSSLQTGRVIGKDEVTITAAGLAYGIKDPAASGNGSLGSGVFPHVEAGVRYGAGEQVDLGLKLSTGGNILLDGKFQYTGGQDGQFAGSVGAGFEMQGSNITETVVFRLHVPLYFSFHPTDADAIYLTPRYAFQFVSDDDNSHFFGGSGGYMRRFSPKISGLVEGSLYLPKQTIRIRLPFCIKRDWV